MFSRLTSWCGYSTIMNMMINKDILTKVVAAFNTLDLSTFDMKGKYWFKNSNKNLVSQIQERLKYVWIGGVFEFAYWVLHSREKDFLDKMICPICGKQSKFNHGVYNEFCSRSCVYKSKDVVRRRQEATLHNHGYISTWQDPNLLAACKKAYTAKTGFVNPFCDRDSVVAGYKRKLGVDNPQKHSAIHAKTVKTLKSQSVANHRRQTLLDKFGKVNMWNYEQIAATKQTTLPSINTILHPENYNKEYILDNFVEGDRFLHRELMEYFGLSKHCMYDLKDKLGIDVINKFYKHVAQDEILEFVRSIVGQNEIVIRGDRSILKHNGKTLELDILLPNRKVAIEYNGIYWHSEQYGTPSDYHKVKTELCEENGIRLIHVFEWEWLHHRTAVENILRMALEKHKPFCKVFTVEPISAKEMNDFCNKYHTHGEGKCSVRFGIFTEKGLTAVSGFMRWNKGLKWTRYCQLPVVFDIDPFELFFEEVKKVMQPGEILVDYQDLDKFPGPYKSEKSGFIRKSREASIYWSNKTGDDVLNYDFRPEKPLTSDEVANKWGYFYKVIGAGRIRWEWKSV